MSKKLVAIIAGAVSMMASCKKDNNSAPSVKQYTVPSTYNFGNANFLTSAQRVKMVVELDTYLKKANSATATTTAVDLAMIANMYNNTNAPFSDATLNTSGVSIRELTADADLYKAYADSVALYNNGDTAAAGKGGLVVRGTGRIIVGPRGLEYGQSYTKGVMGALLFKQAISLLTQVKSVAATDTLMAQKMWDEAFGLLSVPVDYDSSKTYTSADPNRPLLWGGYLAERGKSIQAGGVLFNAFLKGRAAIGAYDINVRNEQADIIMAKWEQLAAAATLYYVTSPTSSSAIGNYGTQLHALSEGQGFVVAFKYRPASSKLSAADLATLTSVLNADYYTLLSQSGFTDLVKAQNILKSVYGL